MKKRANFFLGLGLVAGAVLGMSQGAYAAEVGDFDELKTCLAGTEATCTLTSNIVASEPLTVGRAVTLDLNEFELTYTDPNVDLFEISADGDLTITGDGEITAKRIVADVSGGKLTIESGRIESEANFTIYGYDGATITIDGGEICGNWGVIGSNNTTGDMNVYIRGGKLISSIGATTIYMPTQMDLEISDGEVYGSIVARMGKITISGGTFYASSNYDSPTAYLNYGGSAWLPSALNLWVGSASYTSENARGTQLDLTISGGKFITTETETNYGMFGNADALTNAVALYEVGTAEQTVNITITGGEFDGGVKSYSREDILGTAGAKTVTVTTEISGGMFSEEPEGVIEEEEAEQGEDGMWEIYPKQVDYKDAEVVAKNENAMVVFGKELIGDRKAELNVDAVQYEEGGFTLESGELVTVFSIVLKDRDGEEIEVKDNEIQVIVELSEEEYQALSEYDKVEVVFFDDEGNEAERLEAEIGEMDGDEGETHYVVVFTTTHFSTYGVVGVNEEATVTAPETGLFTKSEDYAERVSQRTRALVTMLSAGMLMMGYGMLQLGFGYRNKE